MSPMNDLRTLLDELTHLEAPTNENSRPLTAILTGSLWQPAGSLAKVTFPVGGFLTHMGLPVDRILIHISGEVSVNKYSREGQGIHDTISIPPQIYGLYETLTGEPCHGVDLQAVTPVVCAEISPDFMKRAIQSDHAICRHALHFLAIFTARMLTRNDQLTLNSSYENLIIYLYEAALGQPLPFRVPAQKRQIAESLHISDRTLYRHLDQLQNEHLIRRSNRQILITTDTFGNLEQAYFALE